MTSPSELAALLRRVADHRAMLAAQCPAPPRTVPQEEWPQYPLAVERWGDAGPGCLLVHGGVQAGLGGGTGTWEAQRPLVQRGWRLILPSRPGFGASASRGVDDMMADAVWLGELVAAEGHGQPVHLGGHSWGGADAVLAAARVPRQVRSLVLIEPAMHPLLPGAGKGPLPGTPGSSLTRMLAAQTPLEYAQGFMQGMGAPPAAASLPDDRSQVAAAPFPKPDDAALARMACAMLRSRQAPPVAMRSACAAVKAAGIPTLVLTGGYSDEFDAVGEIVAELTGGDHRIVRSANHMLQSTAAAPVNEAMDGWWRRAEGTAP